MRTRWLASYLLDAVGKLGNDVLVRSLKLAHQRHVLSRTHLKQLQPDHLVHIPHAACAFAGACMRGWVGMSFIVCWDD